MGKIIVSLSLAVLLPLGAATNPKLDNPIKNINNKGIIDFISIVIPLYLFNQCRLALIKIKFKIEYCIYLI